MAYGIQEIASGNDTVVEYVPPSLSRFLKDSSDVIPASSSCMAWMETPWRAGARSRAANAGYKISFPKLSPTPAFSLMAMTRTPLESPRLRCLFAVKP